MIYYRLFLLFSEKVPGKPAVKKAKAIVVSSEDESVEIPPTRPKKGNRDKCYQFCSEL